MLRAEEFVLFAPGGRGCDDDPQDPSVGIWDELVTVPRPDDHAISPIDRVRYAVDPDFSGAAEHVVYLDGIPMEVAPCRSLRRQEREVHPHEVISRRERREESADVADRLCRLSQDARFGR